MTIDVTQLAALARDLRGAPRRVERHLEQAVAKTARDIAADAQASAPVDTGALRNSISADVGGMEAVIGPGVHYGGYVELGTSRMRAQPYLFPAADRHERPFAEACADAAEQVLR